MTTVNPEYSLNRTFYNALVSRYGFEVPPLFRTPGFFSGVSKWNVEVGGVPFSTGTRIDISVPISIPPPDSFYQWRCKKQYFLSPKEIMLATAANLEECIEKTVHWVAIGKELFLRNSDYALAFQTHNKLTLKFTQ